MSPLFNIDRSKGKPRALSGRRAYIVGDVHGCLDELTQLLRHIEQEIEASPGLKHHIVFLGDLIDRGPASAQVIERLRTYEPARASTHFIMGNHEEVMLQVVAGETERLASWLSFGGSETLASYGLDRDELVGLPPNELVGRVKKAIPREHVEFIEGFADSVSFGDYVFVHAGIRPGIELSEQSQSDLRWIREPFLGDESDQGFTVVHGHTITSEVEVTANRIGIDTGAFFSGRLTALVLEGKKRWIIQSTSAGAKRLPLD